MGKSHQTLISLSGLNIAQLLSGRLGVVRWVGFGACDTREEMESHSGTLQAMFLRQYLKCKERRGRGNY